MLKEPANLAEMLEVIARDPSVIEAVRSKCVSHLPDIPDAFWLRRASIALYGDADKANAALAQIEARRHGKPVESLEVSGKGGEPLALTVKFVKPGE